MTHPYAHEGTDHRGKAEKLIGRTGYKRGGAVDSDAKQDEREVAAGVHKHERHMHPGEKETKLRDGGHVEGSHTREHLAKRARGGKVGKKGATHVNVIVAPQGGGMHPPTASPIAQPAPAMAPHPPMAAPPGVMAPARPMPPPMPGMMRSRGGRLPRMEAGAGGGEGRIEKAREYGKGGDKPKKVKQHA